ncbi:hypothetical protein TRICI_005540 [Trichomonascus ciferrii]|uniref:Major facilitator superfamily (MFS) profile domain-containing protein n=1 Tax=Trichomonascus ciferrii TaxID=44093 RepID=A0A642UU29_9ASCO|nr:hypothetical protein TRICI_005540 [Trichomonascus ciferrii]
MIGPSGFSQGGTSQLVCLQLLTGVGGAFSLVGSRVASQASVPHDNLAIAVSLLSLFRTLGSVIGSTAATQIWTYQMPRLLRIYLPEHVTDNQIMNLFHDETYFRYYNMEGKIRQGAIIASSKAMWYLFTPALAICFIPLICACFQTNFFLGDTQNAVDVAAIAEKEQHPDKRSWKYRFFGLGAT